MKFCPQCGESLTMGDLFCQQCGFRIDQEVVESQSEPFQPTPSPAEPVTSTPAAPNHYEQPLQAAPQYMAPPDPNQDPNTGFGYVPHNQSNGFQNQEVKKKKLIPMLIIIGALLIIGVGCWFAYTKFFRDKVTIPAADTTALVTAPANTMAQDTTTVVKDVQTDQVTVPDNVTLKEASPATTKTTITAKSKVVPKAVVPVRRTERVIEPYKEKNNAAKNQPVAPAPRTEAKVVEPPSQTIFQIGQAGISILKNPRKDCSFTLKERYCITRITTDHNNSGKGTFEVGSIGIMGVNGNEEKQWHARGIPDQNGVPNCKWVVRPNIVLDPGQYSVVDSDRASWSKNLAGKGFVVIEGYKVQ